MLKQFDKLKDAMDAETVKQLSNFYLVYAKEKNE